MASNGAWKQCPNGHWYDSSVTSVCPQCAASAGGSPIQEYGATMPLNGGGFAGGLKETQPAGSGFQDFPSTEPVNANASSPSPGMPTMINFDEPAPGYPLGATAPAIHDYDRDSASGSRQGESGGIHIENFDGPNRTQSAYDIKIDPIGVTTPVTHFPPSPTDSLPTGSGAGGTFSPVVGWLVCIEGADRGRDYRIHAGYNSIGRSESMDIYIAGDSTISRDRHARIAYDPEERVFFFGPAEGRNLVRLNGKLIMQPAELHAYDIIGFNKTKLMFIPFCGERFNWDE